MKDREIDDILARAAKAPHDVDPALLDRVTESIGASLTPVRPLPAAWLLTTAFVLMCGSVAVVTASFLGLHGLENLGSLERAAIFSVLAILMVLMAAICASQMIPGSRWRTFPVVLPALGSVALLAVFGVLFHDYGTENFVAQGIVCLRAGLFTAIPAAVASWLLLRRGFVTGAASAGLIAGSLAGIAGITMLELHCANFELFHVMLWHTAVLPISGAAGALLATALRRFIRFS